MRKPARALTLALMLAVSANAATAAELVVSAAASLTNAFAELGTLYEQQHPGDRVIMNFGGSGQLLQQIERGAPAQVFASADEQTMNRAQARGLIDPQSRLDFARNALVLIVPSDSTLALKSLDDLRGERVKRIAISNPDSVPVGHYSRDALRAAGLWQALQPKLIGTQHVRQSLDYVARDEVDAGFVYSTDAAIMPGKVSVAVRIPTRTPIRYPIAMVTGNGEGSLARSFIEFVRSAPAQRILARFGFDAP